VATAGDDKPDAFNGMVFSFRTSCELQGLDHMEPLLAHGVYEAGDVNRGKWLEMAVKTGRSH
jgi:hypothetical protein